MAGPIVHDGSLGAPGEVALSPGGRYNIRFQNGSRPNNKLDGLPGGNLFHSFSEFSVPSGTTAIFSTNPGTDNVVARVTGGNASQIDGTLATGRAGVSLYLLNPSGILFGKDAALDIRGSFHAIAGDSISFFDGEIFYADPARGVILSSTPVSSFGFINRAASAPIAVSSFLDSRGDISLIGRTVTLNGAYLYAEGSVRITAAGDGSSTVAADVVSHDSGPTGRLEILGTSVFTGGGGTGIYLQGGDMDIRSSVLNFGPLDSPLPADLTLSSSGSVRIMDGSFLGSISGDTGPDSGINLAVADRLSIMKSAVQSFAIGSASAGAITITASELEISGNDGVTVLGIGSTTFASGRGGDIDVSVRGGIRIGNAGTISAIATGSGPAGDISAAAGMLEITGLPAETAANNDYLTGIFAGSYGSGNGGRIEVAVKDSIQLFRGGLIDSSSFGTGRGGRIRVESKSILVDRADSDFFTGIGSDTEGTGCAGTVHVTTKSLDLRNGGLVSAATFGAGPAGNVTITARDIAISGSGKSTPYVVSPRSAIIASTQAGSSGEGGSVTVTATGNLTIKMGGQIGAESLGSGGGGLLTVHAASTRLLSGGLVSSNASGGGAAGNIVLNTGDLEINGSEIGVRATDAKAGNLMVTATGIIQMTGGLMTATATGGGAAGNVTVTADGALTLHNASRIEAATTGRGGAGIVDIRASTTELAGGSLLSSNAIGNGKAGGVVVRTGNLMLMRSEIGVRAASANAGTLRIIAAGAVTMTGGLVTATAGGKGNGGNVRMSAVGGLTIRKAGRIEAASAGSGEAGSIRVDAASIRLLENSQLSSNASGSGRAGGIVLSSGDLVVRDSEMGVRSKKSDAGNLTINSNGGIRMKNGTVTASAGGSGGTIAIRAGEIVRFDGSRLVAEAQQEGGNITISEAPHLILDHSRISANAVEGTGGNILLSTGTYFTNESTVTASSEFGAQGLVRIDPLVALSGGLDSDEPDLLNPEDILQPDCVDRSAEVGSSFTKAGRGGTPRMPGGYLPSFRILE